MHLVAFQGRFTCASTCVYLCSTEAACSSSLHGNMCCALSAVYCLACHLSARTQFLSHSVHTIAQLIAFPRDRLFSLSYCAPLPRDNRLCLLQRALMDSLPACATRPRASFSPTPRAVVFLVCALPPSALLARSMPSQHGAPCTLGRDR